ncbi:beta-3-deoxy-D-manno-oct-2-ulosonic acid transferase [Sphingobium aromaticiconvertens]|uniref:capsular polysaccharide export protein, LipB/KpsS family n=1 Tax=Sphingobium aromaticiconvertens TaxID=365341 RepID=UPI0030194FA9
MNWQPFLRSPPFPGASATQAAISDARATGERANSALLDAIARARVGGTFWGERIEGLLLVVRRGVPVAPEQLAGVAPEKIGVLPGDENAVLPVHGARLLPKDCDPWALVADVQSVHASVEDEIALVAGLLGVPVFNGKGKQIASDALAIAACEAIGAARYRDCFTGKDVSAARAVELLEDWRRHLDGNRDLAAASGMAFWKREAIGHFLWDGQRSPPFMKAHAGLRRARTQGRALGIWPSRVPVEIKAQAAAIAVPIAQIEDGFLRSRGLGAALVPPSSVVIDRSGIYYDATRPSDLETLLATHDFSPALLVRAAALRQRICDSGVGKYGASSAEHIDLPTGRRTILAIGQVEDDLSVRLGGGGIAGNLDFLKRVRAAEPDAWIIYRPHPDVRAGHRKGHVSDAAAGRFVDKIDEGSSLMGLVCSVGAVHVLSSLTGFEALMRGREVVVHGTPFFAGWGLTRDLAPAPDRRGRMLNIDQLVAATLILYPRYLDPVTRLPCGPELLIDRMVDGAMPRTTWLVRVRALQGKLRRFMTLGAEFLHG